MSAQPVSLKGHMHVCPACDPGPRPHIGGPVVSTRQAFVTVNGIPIATVGDTCLCTGVPTTDTITGGSSIATIDGRKIARVGDPCGHGGRLVQGEAWLRFE
ncbi:PAAR domain-containing protein [Shinella oryzae]|uniref:PAAR domain-containing protein n=1 Tax=Shinella oryzae TaxID=2871820 RepID=A0ABY9KB17_9HYPH|nr:PAAR domain-containing protein [Shinella oryzae]WLS05199.1 PAAR domain-containing protein [Shinella oryzae]